MTAAGPAVGEQARRELLADSDLDDGQLAAAAAAAAAGCDCADLYLQAGATEAWMLEHGKVRTGSFSAIRGMALRALAGTASSLAYADAIDAGALARMRAAVRAGRGSGGGRKKISMPGSAGGFVSRYPPASPLAAPDAGKTALLAKVDRLARAADSRVVDVQASLALGHSSILIVRHDGESFADIRPMVRISIQAVLAEGGRTETGMAGFGGRADSVLADEKLLHQAAAEAVREAGVKLSAGAAPAGTMPVVLGNGWAGILLHEAVGHGLEGDFNRKGQSAFSGRIGEQVAHPAVTVCDDGTLAGRRGSLSCDDEGVPSACNVLIENGVLKGYMQDAMNASLMAAAPTGNGRRESYAHLPMPRMTNTYMPAGRFEPEEVIASVGRGVYCKSFSGGQVDITNGNFVFSASEAYLIENGRIGPAIKGATVIGNGPAAMQKLSMVANDFELDPGIGTCGKNGQWVPVGVGQPTCRVDELVVGGTEV